MYVHDEIDMSDPLLVERSYWIRVSEYEVTLYTYFDGRPSRIEASLALVNPMEVRYWHARSYTPIVVGFGPYHQGWNPNWWCICDPYDWYSYVVLPHPR